MNPEKIQLLCNLIYFVRRIQGNAFKEKLLVALRNAGLLNKDKGLISSVLSIVCSIEGLGEGVLIKATFIFIFAFKTALINANVTINLKL